MLKTDRDSLICDLAETYQIYDMRQFSVRDIAIFAYGLGDNSRIRKKISGTDHSLDRLLLASVSDTLTLLTWMLCSKDTAKPASILERLLSGSLVDPDDSGTAMVFETVEDFERMRLEMMGGG